MSYCIALHDIVLHCIICIVQRLSNDTRQRSASARCAIVEDKGYFRGTLAERTAATTVVAVCTSRTMYVKDDLKSIFSVLKMTHEDSLLSFDSKLFISSKAYEKTIRRCTVFFLPFSERHTSKPI